MVNDGLEPERQAWLCRLEKAGAFAPAFELAQLLAFVCDPARLGTPVSWDGPRLAAMEELLTRRCAGEPLQYLLGEWEFYGLPFFVGEGVLIPRADTETLVETALALCAGRPMLRAVDLCSGSGCIAVALGHCWPQAQITAVELSDAAYAYLTRNVAHNGAQNVHPLCADVLEAHTRFTELDLVVSNPPYIPTGELPGLQREVQREPRMALDGREDGLFFYREIARLYRVCLKPGGLLLLEAGDGQAEDIKEILRENGYEDIGARRDLEGFERAVYGYLPGGASRGDVSQR